VLPSEVVAVAVLLDVSTVACVDGRFSTPAEVSQRAFFVAAYPAPRLVKRGLTDAQPGSANAGFDARNEE
jgi:hypothetical protein